MRGYAHSNCKYLRIIKMHDYHESKTVLSINDNHEFKAENVLDSRHGLITHKYMEEVISLASK